MKKMKMFYRLCNKMKAEQEKYKNWISSLEDPGEKACYENDYAFAEEILECIMETRIPDWQAEKLLAKEYPLGEICNMYIDIDRRYCRNYCGIGCRGGFACAILNAARYTGPFECKYGVE